MGRVARIAGGSTLLVAGTAMLVLPGPGIVAIAAGLSLLSKDVEWAQRLRRKIKGDDQQSPLQGQEGG